MDINEDNWFNRMFGTSNDSSITSNVTSKIESLELLNRMFVDSVRNSTDKPTQDNDVISRMFSCQEINDNTSDIKQNQEEQTNVIQKTTEKSQSNGKQKQIVFRNTDTPSNTDTVIDRMFCSTQEANYSEETLFEIVREISSIDISIKEHNLHLRKLRALKNKLEEDLLKYLERFQKEGIRINGTNEIFCSAIKNKKKINKNIHSTQEIQEFAKSHGIYMNQENWQKFEKLWKKNSLTKTKTATLKRIKQA